MNNELGAYKGAVYQVRGTFKHDWAMDIVTVINEDGTTREIHLYGGDAPSAPKVDATPERIAAMKARQSFDKAVHNRRLIRQAIIDLKESGVELSIRQLFELAESLNLKTWHLLPFLQQHQAGELKSKFKISLTNQVLDWARTAPEDRKYQSPLTEKQRSYFSDFL